ncbi:MAG: protein-glutamate O-methyltransferase CheR [Methanoregula sp.]|nr:protein-glutamate O-methyltransferase CheR [Methanoregula sp.]
MDDFVVLKRFIEQTLGIQCSRYKEDYIRRRLLSRMRSTNSATYQDYLAFLKTDPRELENLRNALTINVTEFFRDKEVYDVVKKEVFPALIKQRTRLRIWCAGCSTGEEPYSLAMILSDLMASNPQISARIIATDIDRVVLAKAMEGIYSPKAMVKLAEPQIRRHFTKLPDGNFQVRPHLKELVRFHPHDLMSGVAVSQLLDLITCRNVTIYFNEKQKDLLVKMFHEALASGGFYIMGKTEYLGRTMENLFEAHDSLQKIFIKKD